VPKTDDFREGEPFDAGRIPELDPLLDSALGGEEKARNLVANTSGGQMVTVTPIEGENGRLEGALVGTVRIPNLTGPLLITVGISAVLLTIPAAFLGLIFGFFTAWGITHREGPLKRRARPAQPRAKPDGG
jgi:two-component system, NarL family, sensor histidine kinase LiaS